jgi:hypothetical protein
VNAAEISVIVAAVVEGLGDATLVDRGRAIDALLDIRLLVDDTTQIRVDRALAGLPVARLIERDELLRTLEDLAAEVVPA